MHYHRHLKLISLLLVVVFSVGVVAAPLPLTSSSTFISSKNGIFHSPLGFSLHLGQSNWEQVTPPQNNDYIETIYRSVDDNNIQAALTVRIDKLDAPTTLQNYSKKWMKDYPRFGFEILAAKNVRVGNNVGFMLDLVNHENAKQLRQLLFVKNKNAVTLTCRDDKKSFTKTLKTCNEIVRTFQW